MPSFQEVYKNYAKLVEISENTNKTLDELKDSIEELKAIKSESKRSADVLDRADEKITRGVRSINTDHAAIHLGWGFNIHIYETSLEFGAKKIYRFKGPSTLYAHIKSIQAGCTGATVRAKIIKDATITGNGTIREALRNLNHNATQTAESEIYDGAVTYTGGITWAEVILRGFTSDSGKFAPSQQNAGEFIQNDYLEYVTKTNNENYIIEIENIDSEESTAFDLTLDFFFYEEPLGITNNA